MVELSEAWLAVLNVLVAAPVAWRSPHQVAAALGREVEETTDMLCELDLAGWIQVWDASEGPVVSLSALAADRLGVRLIEVGLNEIPRWAPAGMPDPPPPRPKNICVAPRSASLAFATDPFPAVDVAAERSERADDCDRAPHPQPATLPRVEELPRPTQFVGVGLSPWPGPEDTSANDAKCPACGSKKLGPQMYCIYCDRWGLDRLIQRLGIPATGPSRSQPISVQAQAHAVVDRSGIAHERARRKAERRRRHEARVEADRMEKLTLASNRATASGTVAPNGRVMAPAPQFAQPPAAARNSPRAAR